MCSWSVQKYFQRMLFILAYVTVSYIAANKCATYEQTCQGWKAEMLVTSMRLLMPSEGGEGGVIYTNQ